MIPIYICDDDPVWLNLLKKEIEAFICQKGTNMKIVCSSDAPEKLLKYLNDHPAGHSIYILDVNLKAELDGMGLALKIREKDPRGFIIFVTIHADMAVKTFTYKLEAMDYIIKDGTDENGRPNLNQQVFSCLLRVVDLISNCPHALSGTISVRCNGSDHIISVNDIMFIETIKRSHKLRINLANSSLEISSSLSDMESLLGDDFFMCHKTCLVNLRKIKEVPYTKSEIIMENGAYCPCSIRKLPLLRLRLRNLRLHLKSSIE